MLRMLTAAAAMLAGTAALAQEGTTVEVAQSEEYGAFLAVDGKPVYLFTTDTQGGDGAPPEVSCTEECLSAWPLVATTGAPEAGEGADGALIGTMEHDGQTVVTYGGWPLYHFARDAEGGPPTGQEIESFGGEWYLVAPDGTRIEGEGA